MNNRTTNADFPVALAAKWSLSSHDKKRLKQILVLSAAIAALLWLLYQLAQYTITMGAEQQNKVHVDGGSTKTLPVDPSPHETSSLGNIGEGKGRPGNTLPPSPGLRGLAGAPDDGGSNATSPAVPFHGGQSIFPSIPESDTQQQTNPGFDTRNSPLLGYGNPPMPWITNGGAGSSLPSGGGSGGGADGNGNGASPGGNGGGGNAGTGPGDGPGVVPNEGSSQVGPGGDPSPNGGPSGTPVGTPSGPGDGPGVNPNDNPWQFGPGGDPSPNGGPSGSPAGTPSGPGDDPGLLPNDDPWLGPGGDPSPNGGPSGSPPVDPITGPGSNGTSNATVKVPEPDSIALFATGLLVLLSILRGQRSLSHGRLQAFRRRFAGGYALSGCGSAVHGAAGSHMRRKCSAAFMGIAWLALTANPASAETATVYGNTASIFSANSGAFLPANTNLACFSMNEANCWDGKTWHHLYPSGPRRYALATSDRVACSVIVAPSNDCWTGSVWYRLPKGQLFGVLGGFFSNTPGAFITAPLRSQSVTYTSTLWQSPLGEFAAKR